MEPRAPSVADIQLAVCAVRGISLDDLKGPSKLRRFAHPRQEAMALARRLTDLSSPSIGRLFRRSHWSVLYACTTVARREQATPSYRSDLTRIADAVRCPDELSAARCVCALARTLEAPADAPPAGEEPSADKEAALRNAWKRQAAKTPSHLSSI